MEFVKCSNCGYLSKPNKLRDKKRPKERFCCQDCLEEFSKEKDKRTQKFLAFTDLLQKHFHLGKDDKTIYGLLVKQATAIEKKYKLSIATQAIIIKYACEYENFVPDKESEYGLYQFERFKDRALKFREKIKQRKKEANTPEFDALLDSICQPIYRKNTQTKECYKIIPKDELDFSFLEES